MSTLTNFMGIPNTNHIQFNLNKSMTPKRNFGIKKSVLRVSFPNNNNQNDSTLMNNQNQTNTSSITEYKPSHIDHNQVVINRSYNTNDGSGDNSMCPDVINDKLELSNDITIISLVSPKKELDKQIVDKMSPLNLLNAMSASDETTNQYKFFKDKIQKNNCWVKKPAFRSNSLFSGAKKKSGLIGHTPKSSLNQTKNSTNEVLAKNIEYKKLNECAGEVLSEDISKSFQSYKNNYSIKPSRSTHKRIYSSASKREYNLSLKDKQEINTSNAMILANDLINLNTPSNTNASLNNDFFIYYNKGRADSSDKDHQYQSISKDMNHNIYTIDSNSEYNIKVSESLGNELLEIENIRSKEDNIKIEKLLKLREKYRDKYLSEEKLDPSSVPKKVNITGPYHSLIKYEDQVMPFSLGLLAKVRHTLVKEMRSINIDPKLAESKTNHNRVQMLQELKEKILPEEEAKYINEVNKEQKKKRLNDLKGRGASSNAYYSILALNNNSRRILRNKLEKVLPQSSRFRDF